MSSASVLFDAPGPRARVRNHVISAISVVLTLLVIWVVYSGLKNKGQLDGGEVEAVPRPRTCGRPTSCPVCRAR